MIVLNRYSCNYCDKETLVFLASTPMPEMTVWTPKQIQHYDHPPVFTAAQRKYFLTLPASLQRRVETFYTQTNQMGFTLLFGYFKARHRFFTPAHFRPDDIAFVCRRYGVFAFAFDPADYPRSTYTRHQDIILDYFGYQAFDPAIHNQHIQAVIKAQVEAHLQPVLMIEQSLDWLEQQRIEHPSYFALHTLIVKTIRQHRQVLKTKLEALIEPHHVQTLQTLLQQQPSGHNLYTLTQLKRMHLSDRPKHIRTNVEKLNQLWALFRITEPLTKALGLGEGAIRFFGELTLRYKVSHIMRRTPTDQHLHLLAFVAYQVRKFEDWMTDTFLAACRSMLTRVQNRQRDFLYTHRKLHKSTYRRVLTYAEDHVQVLAEVNRIAYDSALSAAEKIAQIQHALPPKPDPQPLDALREALDAGQSGTPPIYRTL